MGEPLLRLEKLTVGLGRLQLLHGVDLELFAGQRVVISGPSGCGKTTLLKTIAGLIDAVGGLVRGGGPLSTLRTQPAFRRHVVLCQQRPVMIDATVGQNLQRPFAYASADGQFPVQRAKQLLDAMGLGAERWDQEAKSLSEGQQQRVALIRALLVRPTVLLLDEPTSALDERAAETVHEALSQQVASDGMAVLIATHVINGCQRWSDRRVDLDPYIVSGRAESRPDRGGRAGSDA